MRIQLFVALTILIAPVIKLNAAIKFIKFLISAKDQSLQI